MSKRPKGHPRSFKDAEAFEEKFDKYVDRCINLERLANIAGFCAFASITRETFYKQKEYYSDTFNIIQQILEDEAINHKATSMGIFYLKNKFNYVDKQEIKSDNVNHNLNDDVTGKTEEELDEIIKKLQNDNG